MDLRPIIVWFRNDLRLQDNEALSFAGSTSRPIIPLYINETLTESSRDFGAASNWWRHHSLERLSEAIAQIGGRLILASGHPLSVITELCETHNVGTVVWNRRYVPALCEDDRTIKEALTGDGITVNSFPGNVLIEPWKIKTGQGNPFKVFSPFWRTLQKNYVSQSHFAHPEQIQTPAEIPSECLNDWALRPATPDWSTGFKSEWSPGESGAWFKLERFLSEGANSYETCRDIPSLSSTSQLSPHFQFGEISVHDVWRQVHAALNSGQINLPSAQKFLSEIAWRDFSYHLLFHNPGFDSENFKSSFATFPWSGHSKGFERWKKGQTGYPIVDAGMRQLWRTGWMHNRVRMIVASFLTKHLLVHWKKGESWFWDTLVDADPASNPASWQWVAGTGADAAPFFRIFNPVIQGEKFDPDGLYVRKWVPELSQVPNRFIHQPWSAPEKVLAAANVTLGSTYPKPIVEHAEARKKALSAYETLKA